MTEKYFVLERQRTKQSQIISWPIPQGLFAMNLENVLATIPGYEKREFQIYDPETNNYLKLTDICDEEYLIPIKYLSLQFIILRYSE